MVSDAHEGPEGAIRRVPGATWRKRRVHRMRNAFAHVPEGQQTMVGAALRQAFLQADRTAAGQVWRQVADRLRPRWPKLSALTDESGHEPALRPAEPGPGAGVTREISRRSAWP